MEAFAIAKRDALLYLSCTIHPPITHQRGLLPQRDHIDGSNI
jgi:hypothetical protein